MSEHERSSGLSRRAVLGGLSAGAGLGVLAAGLPAGIASASPVGRRAAVALPASLQAQATPLKPALRYVVLCGHDFAPLESPSTYTTLDGQFRFGGTSSGYASVLPNLPLGAVIKEMEVYGTRAAAGVVSLDLWKSTVATGDVVLTSQAVIPAVAGSFTTTLACNDTQDAQFKSTPFVNIDAAAAPGTAIFGIRIGYVSPTGFVPLATSVPPRVYDSRNPGLLEAEFGRRARHHAAGAAGHRCGGLHADDHGDGGRRRLRRGVPVGHPVARQLVDQLVGARAEHRQHGGVRGQLRQQDRLAGRRQPHPRDRRRGGLDRLILDASGI